MNYLEMKRNITKNVRRLRETKGWARQELAAEAKLSINAIQKIERAVNNSNPTLLTLHKLAIAFKISVGELLGEQGE